MTPTTILNVASGHYARAKDRFANLRPWQRRAAWLVAVAVLYYSAERVASLFTMPGTFISVIWPANGIAVAIGILVGPWVAFGVLGADAYYSMTTFGNPGVALGLAFGNALQTFLISWAIRHFAGGVTALDAPMGVARYAVFAGLVGTVTSATIGVTALTLGGVLPSSEVVPTWLVWYASDAVAILLVAPFILVWRRGRSTPTPPTETGAFILALGLAAAGIALLPSPNLRFAFAIVSLPLITWAAFRLGARDVAGTTLILGAAAAFALARGIDEAAIVYFIQVQAFVAAAAVTGLLVSASVHRERERLRVAAEQESNAANDARNKLLSSFAHELNNPLTPILLNIDLLKDARQDDSRRRKSLAIIERNASRLAKLIGDLKDVGLFQSKRAFRLRPCATDLASVASGAVDSYRAAATNAGLRLELDAPDAVEACVDADRITQVLSNLLTNAVKYTPNGRTIRLRLARTRGQATITVEDEGVGMTQDQIQKLFAPFAQVHEAGVQKEGTGLGLYIARGIAEAHGGKLSCESDGPGRGARFTLDLPLGTTDRAGAMPVSASPTRGTPS